MNIENFIQTSGFATILTVLVTVATCIISTLQANKKMKIDNYDRIYNCLVNLTEKRADIVDKCNVLIKELSDALPNSVHKISDRDWKRQCCDTYDGFNKLLTEYSKYLELFMSFSYFLYKNKPMLPVILSECWALLNLYEKFINICNENEYKIRYEQIVTCVQYIKINGRKKEKKYLNEYLKRNQVDLLFAE